MLAGESAGSEGGEGLMSKRAPNSARSYDCSAPNPYSPGIRVRSALDLVPDQVKMATLLALKQGSTPAAIAGCLWCFEASDQDAARLAAVLAEHREAWLPWARLECGELPQWYWGKG